MFNNLIQKIKQININNNCEEQICNDCNKHEDEKNKHIYCRICEDCDNIIHIYCSICQMCYYDEHLHS